MMQTGTDGVVRYATLVVLSLALSLVFLSIAVVIAMASRRKSRAFGVSLLVWFFFVIFYDLLALGITLFLRGPWANAFLFLSLFANPVDLVRVASLIVLDNVTIFGTAGAALLRFFGGAATSIFLLAVGIVLWVLLPFLWSTRLLRRQDI
ncbi:MAG: ABC transporter permease subunit [Bacteroidota bacterium]